MNYEDWRKLLQGERLPAVVVDLDAVDRNVAKIAQILDRSGKGHRLRLATKSVRVPELIARILDFGPPYQGLMCFSAEEAAFLASQGHDDLLIAYPTTQQSDLRCLKELHEAGTLVRLVIDSAETLRAIDAAMSASANPFPVVIDVDMSLRLAGGAVHLGVRRSPVRNLNAVLALYNAAEKLSNVCVVGLMGYEAQVAGLGDRNPFKRLVNPIAALVRRRSVRAMARLRRELAESLASRGCALELFNGGGTGSVTYSVAEPWLTEVTAGSGFLCSHLFDYFSNIQLEPACFFALQTVRSSDDGYVTCQGGGYIASGDPGWDKTPVPHLPKGLKLVASEGCGEVQTPLRVPHGTSLVPPDPVLFRHAKAGELAERFNEYLLVADGRIQSRAKTYRGLGQCFF